MDYTLLGRTGLRVSVVGLGCGGHSRLGQATGASEEDSIRVVRRALEQGVNIVDTAEVYHTEEIVGRAVSEVPRDSVVLSTKKHAAENRARVTGEEFAVGVERSLVRLKRDCVDILHLHGVAAEDYAYAVSELVPAMMKLREQGKVRFLGITEAFGGDPGHRMLQMAVKHDCWDVMMVGFNILNPSARDRVFPKTMEKDIGVMIMFAVRRALAKADRLREVVAELKRTGQIAKVELEDDDPLGFLVHAGGATSMPDAGYRFCRHEPGANVVLSGTGNVDHLMANVQSILRPPLPQADIEKLRQTFGKVDGVSGN